LFSVHRLVVVPVAPVVPSPVELEVPVVPVVLPISEVPEPVPVVPEVLPAELVVPGVPVVPVMPEVSTPVLEVPGVPDVSPVVPVELLAIVPVSAAEPPPYTMKDVAHRVLKSNVIANLFITFLSLISSFTCFYYIHNTNIIISSSMILLNWVLEELIEH
jgi:hypothetical protein